MLNPRRAQFPLSSRSAHPPGCPGAGLERNGELRIALHFYRRIRHQDYPRHPWETFDGDRRVVADFPATIVWGPEGDPVDRIIGKVE